MLKMFKKQKTVEKELILPDFYFDNNKYDWHEGVNKVARIDRLLDQLKKRNILVWSDERRDYVINETIIKKRGLKRKNK